MTNRYGKTDLKIQQAFLDLTIHSNYINITVDMICNKADIHRNTLSAL